MKEEEIKEKERQDCKKIADFVRNILKSKSHALLHVKSEDQFESRFSNFVLENFDEIDDIELEIHSSTKAPVSNIIIFENKKIIDDCELDKE